MLSDPETAGDRPLRCPLLRQMDYLRIPFRVPGPSSRSRRHAPGLPAPRLFHRPRRRRLLLAAGTPSNALGASRIAGEADRADFQAVFAFPCPRCGEVDHLVWERLRWPAGQPDEVEHLCASCGSLSSQDAVRDAMERAGKVARVRQARRSRQVAGLAWRRQMDRRRGFATGRQGSSR